MTNAVWAVIAVMYGYWACVRARSDVQRQRLIGTVFGEAHVTEHRLTCVVVSLLCGGVVAIFATHHSSGTLIAACVACVATGLRVSLVDIDTHSIPRHVMVKSGGVLLALVTVASWTANSVSLSAVLLGGALSWAFMRMVELLSRGDIGHADVVLSGYLGLFVGAIGLQLVPLAIFASFFFAGLVAVVMIATKRMTRRSHIPFGPFLVSGMVLAVLR